MATARKDPTAPRSASRPMKTLNAFLIYRASDVTKSPRLAWDEVAFSVQVRVPEPWGRLAGAIVVELPENGPAVIEVKQ